MQPTSTHRGAMLLLCAVAILTGALPAAADEPPPPGNGGFESDDDRNGVPDGWRATPKIELIQDGAAEGKRFVRLFCKDGKTASIAFERSIPVEPNTLYRITLQARQTDAQQSLFCAVTFDASGVHSGFASAKPKAWSRLDFHVVSGARDTAVKSLLITRSSGPGNDTWDVDAVEWRKVGPAPTGRVGLADEFDNTAGWRTEKATVKSEGGAIKVHGGDTAHWGTLEKDLGVVDLDTYRYLVTQLVDRMGMAYFRLYFRRPEPDQDYVSNVYLDLFGKRKGLNAVDLKEFGCAGVHPVKMVISVKGDAAFDWLRFASDLTPEERQGLIRKPPYGVRVGRGQRWHGLEELSKRRGTKPPAPPDPDGWYPSETVAFEDTLTHTTTWRITDAPEMDKHLYSATPAWDATGRWLLFISAREGRSGGAFWLMDTRSRGLRILPHVGWQWATGDASLLYGTELEQGAMDIYSFDPATWSEKRVAEIKNAAAGVYSPGPGGDGVNMVLSSWSSRVLYLVNLKTGAVKQVPVPERGTPIKGVKSSHLRSDGTIRVGLLFDTDAGRTGLAEAGWVLDRDGNYLRDAPPAFGGHGCESADGRTQFYLDGWLKSNDAEAPTLDKERLLAWFGASDGHASSAGDGWVLASLANQGPWEHLIVRMATDGRNFTHAVCDPDSEHIAGAYESCPRANASPDGTKVLFDSDMLGNSDCYVAVVHPPDPPRNLRARPDGQRIVLAWEKPANCRELRGYHVYRRPEGGGDFRQVDRELLTTEKFTDEPPQDGAARHYVVTAVENFGLESLYSEEACASLSGDRAWAGSVRRVCEAEAGDIRAPMRPVLDGRASGNLAVRMFRYYKDEPGGAVDLAVHLPKESDYRLWARVRGTADGKIEATFDKAVIGAFIIPASAGDVWSWTPLRPIAGAKAPVAMKQGAHTLRLGSDADGVVIDNVVITDEAQFEPRGWVSRDAVPPAKVTGLETVQVEHSSVQLHWMPCTADDLARYDIFCATGPNVECSNKRLVGSTQETAFMGWGLRPGQRYCYAVAAVDRQGNRSAPSDIVTAETPKRESATVECEAESAKFGPPIAKRAEPTASGGACLAVPVGTKPEQVAPDSLVFPFEVPKASRYTLWLRCAGIRVTADREAAKHGSGGGSFLLDGKTTLFWQCRKLVLPEEAAKGNLVWAWVKLTYSGRAGAPVLAGGPQHMLALRTVSAADGDLLLDKFIVTDDDGFVPE